eukprot:COSAG03_NODE_34_length_17821_cov_18.833531_7_plen_45_part_00
MQDLMNVMKLKTGYRTVDRHAGTRTVVTADTDSVGRYESSSEIY